MIDLFLVPSLQKFVLFSAIYFRISLLSLISKKWGIIGHKHSNWNAKAFYSKSDYIFCWEDGVKCKVGYLKEEWLY